MLKLLEEIKFIKYPSGQKKRLNRYLCHCGNKVEKLETSVKDIDKAHCGCEFEKRFATRWKFGKQLKKRWNGINSRTINGNHPDTTKLHGPYANVEICREWKDSFKSFYDWSIENGFKPSLHLDRKDPKKGYEPDNCRWVSQKENNRNGARSKISAQLAREILLLHGVYFSENIAKVYGIEATTVTNIAKGKLWKDVFDLHHTSKNLIRANPKFLLPIRAALVPGSIDFNNEGIVNRILSGYLMFNKETKFIIINLESEFIKYSKIDNSNNNYKHFVKLLECLCKQGDEEFDRVLNIIFMHNRDLNDIVNKFIRDLVVKYGLNKTIIIVGKRILNRYI